MEWFLPLNGAPYVFCSSLILTIRFLRRLLKIFVPCALIKYAFINLEFSVVIRRFS